MNDTQPTAEQYEQAINEMDRLGSELYELRAECGRLGEDLRFDTIIATHKRLAEIGEQNLRAVPNVTVSHEEFTDETDTFGGGTVEYVAGMQFLAKVDGSDEYTANLCLHYDAPGYINDIEFPDPIRGEDLDAYSLVFREAARWYREYKKTREIEDEDAAQ